MSFLDKVKSWFGGDSAPAVKEPPSKKEEPHLVEPASEAEPAAEAGEPETPEAAE